MLDKNEVICTKCGSEAAIVVIIKRLCIVHERIFPLDFEGNLYLGYSRDKKLYSVHELIATDINSLEESSTYWAELIVDNCILPDYVLLHYRVSYNLDYG